MTARRPGDQRLQVRGDHLGEHTVEQAREHYYAITHREMQAIVEGRSTGLDVRDAAGAK